eukprot:gene45436-40088_t
MPIWPFAVLLLDVLLIIDARPIMARIVIGVIVGWAAVGRAESSVRAGLYEPPCGYSIMSGGVGFLAITF